MGSTCAVFAIAVLAVALCSTPDIWEATSGDYGEKPRQERNQHLLDRTPLIVGSNWLANNLLIIENNQLKDFNFNSDLTKNPKWNCSSCQTDLPRLRKGKVGAQFWVAHASCSSQNGFAVEETIEQIDVIKRLIAKYPKDLQFVDSTKGITTAFSSGMIGSLIGVQAGNSIDSRLAVLRLYYAAGVRYLSLALWCSTPWAGNGPTAEGLTDFGREVVLEMNRLGMMVELSGASYQTRLDAINTSLAPVIFTHSNAAFLCKSDLNVPDDILKKVKENGGLVMVNFHPEHLCGDLSTVDGVWKHINHIRKVAGVDHVGIGSYYDGWDKTAVGLEDVSRFPFLFDRLDSNAVGGPMWTDEDLKKLAGQNMLRVFKAVEKVRDDLRSKEILGMLPEKKIRNEARDYATDSTK